MLIVPVRMGLVPRLLVMIAVPVRRISVALAHMVSVIIMTVADMETHTDAANVNTDDFGGDGWACRRKCAGDQPKTENRTTDNFKHKIFLAHG